MKVFLEILLSVVVIPFWLLKVYCLFQGFIGMFTQQQEVGNLK